MRWSTLIVLLATLAPFSAIAKDILVLQPFGSKSHKNVFVPLIEQLVENGHRVTFVTNFPTPDFVNHPVVHEIYLEALTLDASKYGNAFDVMLGKSVKVETTKIILDFPPFVATELYKDPRVKQLVHEHFDLTIVSASFGLASYPLAWHLKTPFIVISPNVLFPGLATVMGDTEHSEYVPFLFSTFTDRMSLLERVANFFLVQIFDYVFNIHPKNAVLSIARETFPDCPPLKEIEANVSLVFSNSHPIFNYPRALPPDVIEVGALHCRPGKPLPEDLEEWISDSNEGFIVFAIGSAIPMTDMPQEFVDAFTKAFSKLPHKVIWQWKGSKPATPDNVKLLDWLPQQDLLGHDRCKLFITHGGLNSLQEAVYHGVPVLGLPFGTDQQLNLKQSARQGYAKILEWTDISEETLASSVHEILGNISYARNARRVQRLFRDQPETPLERAVFWTEHVMRHQGSQHLRLASRDLHVLQRLGFDVFAVLCVSVAIFFALSFYCIRLCCCRRCRNRASVHEKRE